MRKIILSTFLFIIGGCDTIQVRPDIGQCVKHSWARKGVFEVVKKEPGFTILKDIAGPSINCAF